MRLALTGIMLTCALLSCAPVSRLEKGTLVAHGERLDGSPEPLYYSIRVAADNAPDARTMGVLVKLTPDAPPVALSDLGPEFVAKCLPAFVPPPQWPDHLQQKAKEEDAYSGGGFHLVFRAGRLAFLGICSHCGGGREHPAVGTPDGSRFYALPLTERQLTEVFGAPDKVRKVGEVRY